MKHNDYVVCSTSLIHHKYSLQFVFYLLTMTSLTFALVPAARKEDPRKYNNAWDIVRGVCEVATLLSIGYNGVTEFNQLRM